MASNIQLTTDQSGIRLSNSPITFTLNVGVNSMDINRAAIITVYHIRTADNGTSIYETVTNYDVPIASNTFTIDIHSSVNGWFICKKYDHSSIANLKASAQPESFRLEVGYKAKRDYGTGVYLFSNPDTSIVDFDAVDGVLTEYAIYTHNAIDRSTFADPYMYSLKPFTAEIVNYEEQPYPLTSRPYFAEDFKNYRRKRMWFINSLGTLESASLSMLEEMDVKHSTTKNKLYKDASFSFEPITSADKTSRTVWKMSSGYCTQDWCDWWAGEFAFGKRFWMEQNDGTLLPVTINVDSAQSYDKSKSTLGYVNFTVNSAIPGYI